MEHKLSTGLKVKLKKLSLDELDDVLDSTEVVLDKDNKIKEIKNLRKTTTKWLRCGLNGQGTDEFISKLSLDERIEIFVKLQEINILGEGNASNSK